MVVTHSSEAPDHGRLEEVMPVVEKGVVEQVIQGRLDVGSGIGHCKPRNDLNLGTIFCLSFEIPTERINIL